MRHSAERILTTHAGSLARPDALRELLIAKDDLSRVWVLRKVLTPLSPVEAMELLLSRMSKTKTNQDFLASMSNGKG